MIGREDLRRQLAGCAYPGYVYGYPHKKAYRPLVPARSRADAWANVDRRHLFAYVHLPFCEQRCSFCNLFTYVPGDPSPTTRYLDALAREMDEQARILGTFSFARLYLGGGTPTFLSTEELRRLFRDLRERLGIEPDRTQGCIETSPETLDADRLGVLREVGIQRVSLGIQSLVEDELRAVNRRFDFALHERALNLLSRAGFPEFNIDLIYGLPGQTRQSWFHSLDRAMVSGATSLFLYPLYIRPLTGLDRRADRLPTPDPHEMHAWYDDMVPHLAASGFRQQSLRHFVRGDRPRINDEYRCQHDGMVGFGAGARSYTRHLHYSTPWKMRSSNIRQVIDDYCTAMLTGDFSLRHGFLLNAEERLRRWVILSLFGGGISRPEWLAQFGIDTLHSFDTELEMLEAEDCIRREGTLIRLTTRGIRHSDVVAQVFFSPRVRRLVAEFEYDT